ncbi:hypothetical protein N5F07_13520 [Pseudomonas chengduensis]|nr:hypothetical protein [Pseudomonas chengduensis]MDH1622186.1 hypothetical protein [Pseudomonas chengduensis]
MSTKSTTTTKRKRTCHHCKSSYTPSRSDQKFCSDECRYKAKSEKQSKANQKKLERRVSRLRRTGFGQYLVRESVRAGTVQILTGHTPETLHELATLRTDCFINNGVSLDGELNKVYELSHICPVNGHSIVGLLHPHNLVIAEKVFNRSRSKRYMGGGKWIDRKNLLPQWHVDADTPVAQVYSKIEKFLGQTLKDYLSEHSPKLSYKERLVNKLIRHGLSAQEFESKEAKKRWEDRTRRILQNFTSEELEQKALDRNLTLSSFNVSTTRYLPVMIGEIRRFKSYGVSIDPTFEAFADYLYELQSMAWTGDYVLEIDGDDWHESEWVSPSIQYWMAKQLCSLLHKEKPEFRFNGKPYAECFQLPEFVSKNWKPVHRVEEWKIAQHGRPPEPARPVYSVVLDSNPIMPWEELDFTYEHSATPKPTFDETECPF